ncbi:hypothetical protein CHS0354_012967 [Potamilus streckersoni]|uniref:Cystatin domain-containing protein n=1 Tax=Potamilus streckersoni TaxID=2493646 RepID=A0AAE0SMG2_9BIVA|nr:hypothetical protein CHS0354_012967 [Potamilus streckersoni]
MKKTVLLVGFVGLCLASPFLEVSENDTFPVVNHRKIQQAAVVAVGADDDDIERGCKNATLTSIFSLTNLGYDSEGAKGINYAISLRIRKADGTDVRCSTRVKFYNLGSIGVVPCICESLS